MKRLAVFALFLIPAFAHAQFGGVAEPLQMVFSPERPGAFQTVAVTLESSLAELSAAEIIWLVNDAVVAQGMGKTRISIRTL